MIVLKFVHLRCSCEKQTIYTSNLFVFLFGWLFHYVLSMKTSHLEYIQYWKYQCYIPIRIYKIDKSFPNLETSCKNQEQRICFEECVAIFFNLDSTPVGEAKPSWIPGDFFLLTLCSNIWKRFCGCFHHTWGPWPR